MQFNFGMLVTISAIVFNKFVYCLFSTLIQDSCNKYESCDKVFFLLVYSCSAGNLQTLDNYETK